MTSNDGMILMREQGQDLLRLVSVPSQTTKRVIQEKSGLSLNDESLAKCAQAALRNFKGTRLSKDEKATQVSENDFQDDIPTNDNNSSWSSLG